MQTIRLIGEIDEQHRLVAKVPNSVPPGSVEVLVIARATGEDEAGLRWMDGIAHEWQDELGDPRQDIYDISDGVPSDPGEIHPSLFSVRRRGGMKLRPILLLTGPIGTVPEHLVAYISSVPPDSPLPFDVVLDPHSDEHSSTNLKTVSVLRLHKLATIHQRSVIRYLGSLSTNMQADVGSKLRMLLGL
jgi:hypothetical protein